MARPGIAASPPVLIPQEIESAAVVTNILWLLLGGGLVSVVKWSLVGLAMTLTIIGLPFAVAAFRLANLSFFPLGRHALDARLLGGERHPATDTGNFLWAVLIGIPFGLVHIKLATVSIAPLGKRIDRPWEVMAARAASRTRDRDV